MMSRKFYLTLFIFSVALFAACNTKPAANSGAPKAEIKRGVTPVADPEIAVIEMENGGAYGTIKIELYSNVAPKMVARFKELAKEGFYNGTTFHRADPNLGIIQGGDPNSKDSDPSNDGVGSSDKPNVDAEFSDVPYDAGTVGAARSTNENSANSQFYITLKRQPDFDTRYTVFGKVIEGLNNAKTIAGAPRSGDKPIEPAKIKSITIQPR